MTKLVILPSAKLAPIDLQADFGPIPSCMVPINSKPALVYITDSFIKKGYKVVIGANEGYEQINNYIKSTKLPISLIKVGNTSNLAQTLINVFTTCDLPSKSLVINFGDTCIQDQPRKENVIFFSKSEEAFRWTTFNICKDQKIFNIQEKNVFKTNNKKSYNVFTGLFYIAKPAIFIKTLQFTIKDQKNNTKDPFYQAIEHYFNNLNKSEKLIQETTNWFDFGHLDTFSKTRRKIALKPRFFNTVQVDEKRGILRKESKDIQKFSKEINWYLSIPKPLQYLTPRVFNFDINSDEPFAELEYYSYPTLSDLYLYGYHDVGVWTEVLNAIGNAIEDFQKFKLFENNLNTCTKSMEEMYIEKTIERINKIKNNPKFNIFFQKHLTINNEKHFGVNTLLNKLSDIIKKLNLLDWKNFIIIHGDLCLSNILYDRRNNFIRLIDPRGSFGSLQLYGDSRYDLAKLTHSFEGGYDFIVNGLFTLELKSNKFHFTIHENPLHKELKFFFSRWLKKRVGEATYKQIKLIECLLFLSMVPLHADQYISQQAFLIQALLIFKSLTN